MVNAGCVAPRLSSATRATKQTPFDSNPFDCKFGVESGTPTSLLPYMATKLSQNGNESSKFDESTPKL